jgi:hypothetical protein
MAMEKRKHSNRRVPNRSGGFYGKRGINLLQNLGTKENIARI